MLDRKLREKTCFKSYRQWSTKLYVTMTPNSFRLSINRSFQYDLGTRYEMTNYWHKSVFGTNEGFYHFTLGVREIFSGKVTWSTFFLSYTTNPVTQSGNSSSLFLEFFIKKFKILLITCKSKFKLFFAIPMILNGPSSNCYELIVQDTLNFFCGVIVSI